MYPCEEKEETKGKLLERSRQGSFLIQFYAHHADKWGKDNIMAEFTPITTQEEFDAAIKDRLTRDREAQAKKAAEKYADYDDLKAKTADYEKRIASYTEQLKGIEEKDKKIAELEGSVKKYETSALKTRIAHETGLDYSLAARLSGDTEDEIRADAKSLSETIGKMKTSAAPARSTEPAGAGGSQNSQKAGYAALLSSLKE